MNLHDAGRNARSFPFPSIPGGRLIIGRAEVDRVKQPEVEEEEDKSRLDILDDPVRMYLKQMGQVPLLTREQEVEISKRIEDAESQLKRTVYSFGFAAKEHIALAEKLISEPPKERFDRVIVDKSTVPVKTGVVTLVMLSVFEVPLSLAASRKGIEGAAGAIESSVMSGTSLAADWLLLAGLVAVTKK